jgi:hypothetical protein
MLPPQLVQVADCQLQDVRLLQFADVLTFRLQGRDNKVLQFVQALVYPGTPFPFQHWLHDLRRK